MYFTGPTRFKAALTKTSSVLGFLSEMQSWIKTWKIRNKKGDVTNSKFRFINGLLINMAGVQLLLHELVADDSLQYLCTRRLTTDPLENFFAIIRGKGGFNQNPSCYEFSVAFKQAITN